MQKYEYQIFERNVHQVENSILDFINGLGSVGWELVNVCLSDGTTYSRQIYFFKREINDKDSE